MANTPNIVRAVGNQLGTTLNAGISSSASSITLVDATGFSTDGGYIIIDENITGKEEIVYVTGVAGSTLTVATDGRGRCGTSATSHDAGATVSDILVDEHINGIADKFIIEHNDDGTHTEDYATLTGTQELANKTLTSPTVNTPTLILADSSPTVDGSIGFDRTGEDLQVGDGSASQVVHMGAWTAWTPAFTNLTIGNGTNTGSYCKIGKLVHFKGSFTFGSSSSVSGLITLTLPLAAQGEAYNNIGAVQYSDITVDSYWGTIDTSGRMYFYSVTGTKINSSVTSSTAPYTWATGDIITYKGTYETSA